ncbi:MAG: DUF1998 domain-containing protein [Clostridiaceae bacterium]
MNLKTAMKMRVNNTVRASQAVLQYGVGAMVDFPDQTLMTAAPEYWEQNVIEIHDERLEKALHVDYFGMPGGKNEYPEGISYARFPEWYFCPQCRRFQPLQNWVRDFQRKVSQRTKDNDMFMVKHMRCQNCKQNLVVARIIVACEHGHIDDFPWVKWVHCQNLSGAKKVCNTPSLKFNTGASSTEGLEGLVINCESCHAKATLKGAFDIGKFDDLDKKYNNEYDFSCTGRHPWKNQKTVCIDHPRVMQRGSSSVYFPVTASSLVIPPYSNRLTTLIENSKGFSDCKTTILNMSNTPGLSPQYKENIISSQIDSFSEKISLEIGITSKLVKGVLKRKWDSSAEEDYSTISVKYKAEEYRALSGEITLSSDDCGEFSLESTKIVDYGLPYIKRISLIHKVREVQALIGFTRIQPAEKSETTNKPANVVSVKEDGTKWYPAYEVRGEGVFIEFDSQEINKWRKDNEKITKRVEKLNENYLNSFIGSQNPRDISAKFILIHTISHLLIKQLSFECGYSIASLKERIYCSEKEDGYEMAGIFIYTASGDSEGTMGGLVRQGRSDSFPKIFKKAIESSLTCSNDPVCSLSLGQGRDSMNLSACHSCTLIPETSCEEFNILLDRGFVVGTFENKKLGFFYDQLFGSKEWSTLSRPEKPEDKVEHKPKSEVVILNSGIDMIDVSYFDIWKDHLQWSEHEVEQRLLSDLLSRSSDFLSKEKPLQDATLWITENENELQCDLLWKNSKVMFFSSENQDNYELAKNSDWICFSGLNEDLTVDMLNSSLKGSI